MQLFDLVNVIIEIVILLFYSSTLLEFKHPMTFLKVFVIMIFIGTVSSVGIMGLPSFANLLFSCLYSTLLIHYLFEGRLRNKLFFVAIYIVASIFADILAVIVITIFGISYNMVGGDNVSFIVGAMLSNFIRLWLCAYVGRILSRRLRELPVSYWIFLILCPVLSILCLVIFDVYLMQAQVVNSILVFVPALCILYINLMLFRFFETYSSNIRLRVVEKLAEQNQENYRVLKSNEDELRTLRHDMKNHIMVLYEHIKNNDVVSAESHLKGIEKTIKNISSVIYTSHPSIDAALNIGGRKARSERIDYDVQVQLNGEVHIDAADISKLLNNAIDNAIEAAMQCENGYIFTELSISPDEMKIHIENSAEIKTEQFTFITTKKDKRTHGYGMKSIKSVVKKYNGYMNYKAKDDTFYLDIILKNKKID